jgi:hypothetical protein
MLKSSVISIYAMDYKKQCRHFYTYKYNPYDSPGGS